MQDFYTSCYWYFVMSNTCISRKCILFVYQEIYQELSHPSLWTHSLCSYTCYSLMSKQSNVNSYLVSSPTQFDPHRSSSQRRHIGFERCGHNSTESTFFVRYLRRLLFVESMPYQKNNKNLTKQWHDPTKNTSI